jgi:uncharacterized protein with PCYCGC motif
MGKKKDRNAPVAAAKSGKPAKASSRFNPWLGGAILVAVVGVGALLLTGGTDEAASPAATQAPEPDPRAVARAAATASQGPRKHASLPPIPFQGYAPPRSTEVITAAYRFAADHPEILSYVPCFCGCERSGHGANHDCFVKQRAENGDVVAWDEHGVECAVCIDVANRSRQMFESGASVRDIRAAIDKEFGANAPGAHMPTPKPPAAGAHGAH